ncbi:hypothetical protein DD237_001434 [Peronospora effusa]|uniref:Phosphatidate cytidylyltransferase n=1 Tax=Peronospora effusa TaxID=542832 RepID=A0A3R7W7D6_9STRA|nr:hypothetical protein DD237_001434 [Peronospora effusa]
MDSSIDLHPVLGDGGGMFFISSFPPRDPDMFEITRPSSVAILRGPEFTEDSVESLWHKDKLSINHSSRYSIIRLFFDSLVLLSIAAGVVLAAYMPIGIESSVRRGGALPYIYAVFVAIAGYEYAWLAYRVRLKLLMPFKLYEKHTSREMYRQMITYAVDEESRAVTWIAEKRVGGNELLAAVGISFLAAGGAVGLAFVPGITHMPVIYVGVCTFVGMLSATLAPNIPTAVCVIICYTYFFLSSLNVVLRTYTKEPSGLSGSSIFEGPDNRRTMDKYLAMVVESYSLLLLAVGLLLMSRAVTSKDSMELTLMIVLDITGLLYLSCSAVVLELFEQSTRVHASGALAGFFVIVWSAEFGAFLTERILKAMHFSQMHPFSMASSQQNFERLFGAIGFAVGAAVLAADFVEFDMNIELVALVCVAAVVCAHIGKLFLGSLEKIANVSETGSYLRVGGGVLDRLDTLLFMAVVFAPFFHRAIYKQPQW